MAWSRCLAIETARFGIHVGIVCPGRVETKFFDHATFKARAHRRETGLTVPMPEVVDAILDTIVRRRKVRFVPRYFGLLAWAVNAFGPLLRGLLDRLMTARVEDLYGGKSAR
jgi:short-subunit dehydrogenase